MKLRLRMVVLATMLMGMCGCSAMVASIPMGSKPDSPVATAAGFRLWYDSNISVGTPEGMNLAYGGESNENAPAGAIWMRGTLDALTALANSQAAQAAMAGYMQGAGVGLPLGGGTAALPAGTSAAALQGALKAAGCPLAEKLSPAAFANLLAALAAGGTALDVNSLLPILGGGR